MWSVWEVHELQQDKEFYLELPYGAVWPRQKVLLWMDLDKEKEIKLQADIEASTSTELLLESSATKTGCCEDEIQF